MDNLTHFFLQSLASSSTNLMPDLKGHECKFLMVNALWVMKCRAMTCPEQFIFFDHVHKNTSAYTTRMIQMFHRVFRRLTS